MKVSEGFVNLLFDDFFAVKEKQNSVQFNYYGNNTDRVLHIIDFEFLNESDKDKMAQMNVIIEKGLLLNPPDNAIISIADYPSNNMVQFVDYFTPNKVIIWGCNDFAISQLNIKDYEIIQQGNIHVLKAEPVTEYLVSSAKKQQLWVQIKRLNNLV